MSSVREELASFNQFATERLSEATSEPSFEQLFIEWQDRHEKESIHEAIRRGIADVDAGRVVSARESLAELDAEFGFDDDEV